MKQALHYDVSKLTWDVAHKKNEQGVYCYCGGSGHWNLKMLQCYKCQQWFHEACLQCLTSPLLNGDRFFIFACSTCNEGNEFIHRLPLRWVDVVHLVIYNITLDKKIKYFDVNETIVPYFNQHWDSLRLGELAFEASTRQQLRDRVNETLTTNHKKFQCGSESKKSKNTFRLRLRKAPEAPHVNIPKDEVINDELVESLNLRHGSDLITMELSPPPTPTPQEDVLSSDAQNSESAISTNDPVTTKRSQRKRKMKKSHLTYDSSDSQDSSFEAPPKKRGRGRPRSQNLTSLKKETTSNGGAVGRGRGKPKSSHLKPKTKLRKNSTTASTSSTSRVNGGAAGNKSSHAALLASAVTNSIPAELLTKSKPIPINELSGTTDLIAQIPRLS